MSVNRWMCKEDSVQSESHSVVTDFLRPHGLYSHGILQAGRLEWGAIPFSRGSSQSRDGIQVSSIAGRFFTSWATGKSKNAGVGKPIRSPADPPDPGIKPASCTAGRFFTNWIIREASISSLKTGTPNSAYFRGLLLRLIRRCLSV